jgi:hypothetical protein
MRWGAILLQCGDSRWQGSQPSDNQDDRQAEYLLADDVPAKRLKQ